MMQHAALITAIGLCESNVSADEEDDGEEQSCRYVAHRALPWLLPLVRVAIAARDDEFQLARPTILG